MFVIKSLLGKMWGNPANPELIQIPAGQLYLSRPDSVKGSRECIFKDAVATIRRTGSEFQHQLVITRAYEDGEEQLLDEDSEIDDERVFLVDEGLQFRFSTLDGDAMFAWRDFSGEEGDLWEFISSRTVPKATNGLFELTILHCVFERKYNKSHNEASEADLAALRYAQGDETTEASRPDVSSTQDQADDPFKDVPVLQRTSAELYLFDTDADVFVIQEKSVTVDMASNGEYDVWLVIKKNTTPFISLPIDGDMVPRFDIGNHAFMFTFREEASLPGLTWCLKFDSASFSGWKEKFTIFLWEGKNRTSYAKAKSDERRYIQEAYEDVEMEDAEAHEDLDDEADDYEGDRNSQTDAEESQEDDAETEEPRYAKGSRNEHLIVGYKDDLSFVTRGDMIGVFAPKEERLRFRTTIDRIKDLDGKSFSPRKMMLHRQDNDMLLLDPQKQNSVYRMDLEYGKVVDEWKISDHLEVDNIIPESKFAQMNPEQTFIGHSHNGLFRIDPRLSGNKLVESSLKQYASKNDFTAAATTESGRLAVASNKGDIRLFDQLGKNAKTALPALGDPIIGVDVSADGRWVVATCRTYLLLIDTLIGDGRYKGSLGFDRSFPAESKPVPRRLQLKAEHAAYMTEPVSFTPARFNTSPDGQERTIVTSTGKYVIIWNFRRLKQGQIDYQIKQYDSRVVADNFKFGADKSIIVALEQNVFMANKKDLVKPSRASIAPPSLLKERKSRESHSQVVNSPY